jgi:hypothetical protein
MPLLRTRFALGALGALALLTLAHSAFAVDLGLHKSEGKSDSLRNAAIHLYLASSAAPEAEPIAFPEGGTCSLTTMSCNSTRTGSLGAGDCWLDSDFSYLDFWTFSGTAGQQVTITMRSAAFDAYLFLMDPDANVVAQNDDAAGGNDARISWTLSKSGTWAIVANQADLKSGSYTLQLECGTTSSCVPQVRTMSCGQNVSGIIDSVDCTADGLPVEFWTFTGTAGQPFTASVARTGGTGNVGVAVFLDDGSANLGIDAPDSGSATVTGTLPKSGKWVVAVYATAAANYSLTTSCQTQSSGCQAGVGNLCLNGKRFRVTVTAKDPRTGNTGTGVAIPYNDLNGFFAIPALTGDASNFEVFVKVLDGRRLNGRYWVFYGGLTDFEYTISVTDSVTGQTRSYTKAGGQYAGGADVSAF